MEDNKKNAKILSDEELENVAGGICPRMPTHTDNWQATSSTVCPRITNQKSCERNYQVGEGGWTTGRRAGCAWRDGKCIPLYLSR